MNNKTALVTGASSGIGEAAALRLQRAGYTVYGAARRVDRMTGLTAAGVRVLEMDVTDGKSMADGVSRIVTESGAIEVLVNNAGFGSYGALEDVAIDDARYQFEVNVFGWARLTQLVLPAMRAQGSGRIINISSIGGKIYEPLGARYHATKFAPRWPERRATLRQGHREGCDRQASAHSIRGRRRSQADPVPAPNASRPGLRSPVRHDLRGQAVGTQAYGV